MRLAFVLVAGASVLGGCALPEMMEEAKCRIPPHYPHEFSPPSSPFGHYATRWQTWPGAEAIPGQTLSRQKPKKGKEGATGAEELTAPKDEEGAPPLPPEGESPFDMPPGENMRDNANPFDEPDTKRPPEDMPPDTTEVPEIAPREGMNQPSTEAAPNEAPPESLIPEDNEIQPSDATPEQGAWDINSLPSDAPTGSLIPDEPEIARRATPPGLLVPEKEMGRSGRSTLPANENVKRPVRVRGASAMERMRDKNIRSSSHDAKRRQPTIDEATVEGPQLFGTAGLKASKTSVDKSANAAQPAEWLSMSPPEAKAAERDATPAASPKFNDSVAPSTPAGWRANPVRSEAAPRASSTASTAARQDGWQRHAARPDYPGVQTSHTEAAPAKPTRATEYTAGGSSNPLR